MGINLYWPKCKQSTTQKIDPLIIPYTIMLHYWMVLQIRERRGANGVVALRISKKKKKSYLFFIYFYLGDGVFRFLDLSLCHVSRPWNKAKFNVTESKDTMFLFKQLTLDANSINLTNQAIHTTQQNLMHGFIILSSGHRK